jgi:hypothetical protein
MEKTENEEVITQKGDLILMMNTKPVLVDEEASLLACFWSLARVTVVTPDGAVSAYRTFGAHYVSRDVPEYCQRISARLVDVPAIEKDMKTRVETQRDANEFVMPEHAYEYVNTFMLEAENNRT